MVTILMGCSDRKEPYNEFLSEYKIQSLPVSAFEQQPVIKALDELKREPCDYKAAWGLSNELARAGFRREAATVLIEFTDRCHQGTNYLSYAIPLLQSLGDLDTARKVADRLVDEDKTSMEARLARADILKVAGQYKEALDDYRTGIALSSAPSRLISAVYEGAAEVSAKLGKPCEGAALVRKWVNFDPSQRSTPRTEALIAHYAEQGHCKVEPAPKAQTFARKPNGVIRVRASINGHEGTFLVDSGASIVGMSAAFARRAGVPINTGQTVRMHTANGDAEAILSSAKTITLGTAKAADVEVTIKRSGSFGPDIDGLLGQSFLSRFEVTFQPDRWTIAPRSSK